MIGFIDIHRAAYGVEPICRVLPIAPSVYYAHQAAQRDPSRLSIRGQRDAALTPQILRVFNESICLYGARKLWQQLKREGIKLARCTVERLMKSHGLQGARRGGKVTTTRPDPAASCPLNKVNRDFKPPAPNMLWVSDLPMSGRGQALSIPPLSSTPLPGGSSAGRSVKRLIPTWFWPLSIRPSRPV
ncbi:MAG: hypothetical protein Alpg2KO_08070 [Alphaproteobacteria bacterium]